jgi:hypothetical protein
MYMKTIKALIVLIVLLLIVTGLAYLFPKPTPPVTTPTATSTPETSTAVDTTSWQTYVNEKYGFELKYPPDWHLITRSSYDLNQKLVAADSEFYFSSPSENGMESSFIVAPLGPIYVPEINVEVTEEKTINDPVPARWREIASASYIIDKFQNSKYPLFRIDFRPTGASPSIRPNDFPVLTTIFSTFRFTE